MTLLKQTETKTKTIFHRPMRSAIRAGVFLGIFIAILYLWQMFSPLFIDTIVNEPFPFGTSAKTEIMSSGQFNRGSGQALIYQKGTERLLWLQDFEVNNGPGLQVLLVEHIDGHDSSTMGVTINLGELKGNIGNQGYEIPADVDLSKFDGVMIYCEPFQRVFSTATLGN